MTLNPATTALLTGAALALAAFATVAPASAQTAPPACAADTAPFRDFDFVIGDWDFFTADGQLIGRQTYERREQGCLIVEDWSLLNGATGMGMTFYDPLSERWRQVWMSPSFHIDYSGGLNADGAMELTGRLFNNRTGEASGVHGVWAPQPDGSIHQEFWLLDESGEAQTQLFAGTARPRSE